MLGAGDGRDGGGDRDRSRQRDAARCLGSDPGDVSAERRIEPRLPGAVHSRQAPRNRRSALGGQAAPAGRRLQSGVRYRHGLVHHVRAVRAGVSGRTPVHRRHRRSRRWNGCEDRRVHGHAARGFDMHYVRLLPRLVSDRRDPSKVRPARPCANCLYHLPVLRRRLRDTGEDRRQRPDNRDTGRSGQPILARYAVREGAVRVLVREPPRPDSETDDPQGRRAIARGVGRGSGLRGRKADRVQGRRLRHAGIRQSHQRGRLHPAEVCAAGDAEQPHRPLHAAVPLAFGRSDADRARQRRNLEFVHRLRGGGLPRHNRIGRQLEPPCGRVQNAARRGGAGRKANRHQSAPNRDVRLRGPVAEAAPRHRRGSAKRDGEGHSGGGPGRLRLRRWAHRGV